jgi:hypothetical protein
MEPHEAESREQVSLQEKSALANKSPVPPGRKDYGDAATQFGIEVLTPAVAIKRIRG